MFTYRTMLHCAAVVPLPYSKRQGYNNVDMSVSMPRLLHVGPDAWQLSSSAARGTLSSSRLWRLGRPLAPVHHTLHAVKRSTSAVCQPCLTYMLRRCHLQMCNPQHLLVRHHGP